MHEQFLQSLWGMKDEELGYILIWLHDGKNVKNSYWFKTADEAAEFVSKNIDQKVNIYMGVGLSPKAYEVYQRCLKQDIAGIGGLWLDLDIVDPLHAKPNLPRTVDEAMELIDGLPNGLVPSVVIHSGHGLQAWWMFREPWMFDSQAEHDDAELLEKRFIYYFKSEAKKRGWDVDSVFNLDRVLRVPGTTNYKGVPVEVKTLTSSEKRYNPSDFEWLPDVEATEEKKVAAGSIVLNPNANPPFDLFNSLMELEPKFKLSWEKQRKDFQDQSASSYNQSLANFGILYGWRDQEIVDLLIAFRRKHNMDLKLREDYYVRTLTAAKRAIEKIKAQESIDVHTTGQETGAQPPKDENQKESIKQNLSALFGVQLIRIMKFKSDPPVYKLVTGAGEISLGEVDGLILQGALRSNIAAATGRYLPRFKAEKWDNIAQALLDICDEVEVGEDATEAGEMRAWLRQYLEDKTVYRDDKIEDAIIRQLPIERDGRVYVFGADLRKWLKIAQQEKVNAKRMGYLMRSIGCEPDKLNIVVGGKSTTRNAWLLPREF